LLPAAITRKKYLHSGQSQDGQEATAFLKNKGQSLPRGPCSGGRVMAPDPGRLCQLCMSSSPTWSGHTGFFSFPSPLS